MAKEEYVLYRKTYDSQAIVEYVKSRNAVYEIYLKVENGKITLTKKIQGEEIIKTVNLGKVTDLLED